MEEEGPLFHDIKGPPLSLSPQKRLTHLLLYDFFLLLLLLLLHLPPPPKVNLAFLPSLSIGGQTEEALSVDPLRKQLPHVIYIL